MLTCRHHRGTERAQLPLVNHGTWVENMRASPNISVLFLDIGGVLLTNGWDREMRRRAAEKFGLDLEEMNERHHLTFDTYERGLLSLDEYLRRVVFYQDRVFTPDQFRNYMFSRSQALDDNITMFRRMARANGLKVGAVSNEGRELAVHRIRKFHLTELVEFFVVSSFVRFRKPDVDIFRLALDIAQAPPAQAVYVEDRLMFVEVARELGIHSIRHETMEKTLRALDGLGLKLPPAGESGGPRLPGAAGQEPPSE
jgi:putative hydrolase of the HAD superfamily